MSQRVTDEVGWLDASADLGSNTPSWPGSHGVTVSRARCLADGDPVNETFLEMDVHCGTHVDAPSHFVPNGTTVDEMPISTFVGLATVVDLTGRTSITALDIQRSVPRGTQRVLFRTDNSVDQLMRRKEFNPDFVALTLDGAQALADRDEVVLIGNDYLSIQEFGGDDETHRVLLRRGIAAVEGLDLADISAGQYELVALPIRICGAEAAPLRAILRLVVEENHSR